MTSLIPAHRGLGLAGVMAATAGAALRQYAGVDIPDDVLAYGVTPTKLYPARAVSADRLGAVDLVAEKADAVFFMPP